MDLTLLQRTLRQFAAERDWEPFHTPKNLVMALMVEAAELAEIFQWLTPEQSQACSSDRVVRERIGDEVADVLLYLLQLADHCEIDLPRAVSRKLRLNAAKHPPVRQGLPVGPLAQLAGDVHVLIDWENVQPQDADLLALVPEATHVWLFHNRTQKVSTLHQGFGERRTLIPITRSGKNALDFHLTFYMGYIISRHPEARIVVLSNDQGYAPMLEHAQDLGFRAELLGFGPRVAARRAGGKKKPVAPKSPEAPAAAKRTRTAAKKTAGRAVPTASAPASSSAPAPAATRRKPAAAPKSAAPSKAAPAAKSAGQTPAKRPARTKAREIAPQPATQVTEADKEYAHVLKALRKTTDKPMRLARLQAWVRSLLAAGQPGDEAVQATLSRLVADGQLSVSEQGAVRYPGG